MQKDRMCFSFKSGKAFMNRWMFINNRNQC